MSKRVLKLLGPVILSGFFILYALPAAAADKPAPPAVEKKPPYPREQALRTVINPHEQINDEGEILWGTCTICHQNTPDVMKEKSIKDVQLHFPDDLNQICRRCHDVKPHPAGEGGVSATMSGFVAPNHLVVPSKPVQLSMRLSLKETPTILPLDPKSGKIFCSTCHNPHERGLLLGRADYGGDYTQRLRSAGLDICQYCHRK
ncbi:MAG: hypothetical protein HY889_01095 [Deltaproteobacteria bacterium]|nr:hypothetical protein [Deltaproteobacteria bacterium]